VDRGRFLLTLAGLHTAGQAMKPNTLERLLGARASERMPVLFLGHGSPMNAIEQNAFTEGFRQVGRELPRPEAILCISAHWETRGTWITAMERPRTIHDFGGFPKALFEVEYPAPGSPSLANEAKQLLAGTEVGLDQEWGLDHGAWSVAKHLYPEADVPLVELSLDRDMRPEQHYALAKQLAALRDKGVLIIGSGNMVHNLRMVAWDKINEPYAYPWAAEAQERMSRSILNGDHAPLIAFHAQGRAFELATNSSEHFLPLLYALALQRKDEQATLFNDKPLAGSLTMTSVRIG
jgi:4,5-DOPA dioxygenase extradiol